MPCTYCPYKLLPNAYSIYVWQYTHICTYMWREDSPPQFLPTTCPLPPGNACVWQLQLYFRMEGCGGGGDVGMHGGRLHKSLQTFCQAMLTASQYTKCEWYGLFVSYGCWPTLHPRFLKGVLKSQKPYDLFRWCSVWVVSLPLSLSPSVPFCPLIVLCCLQLSFESFWLTSLIIRHVSQSRQLNLRI